MAPQIRQLLDEVLRLSEEDRLAFAATLLGSVEGPPSLGTLDPEVPGELDDAIAWYERRSPGLGLALIGELQGLLRSIAERPESFPECSRRFRILFCAGRCSPAFPIPSFSSSSVKKLA